MGWRCSGKLGKDEIDSCISTYDTVEEKERKIDLCDMGRLTFSGDLSLLEHLWIISSSIFPISGALGIAVELADKIFVFSLLISTDFSKPWMPCYLIRS